MKAKKALFRITFQSKYGMTVATDTVKLDAYQYMAMLQNQGHKTSTTFHADEAITVAAAGLESMTFMAEAEEMAAAA